MSARYPHRRRGSAEARRSDAITQLYAAQAYSRWSRAIPSRLIPHPPSDRGTRRPSFICCRSQLEDAMTLSDGENPFYDLAAVDQGRSLPR